ncbi:PadR family transcriptional regulator [Thomasclavelia cocleata]|uniref:PadR family transcriptional regulator n=1 Tax=Thomasclavelia cocleata TaxID=69824 RepID=UPI002558237A|nr:helix-turn-helix transcriptional regulator [Thomasclavelia cocleata]
MLNKNNLYKLEMLLLGILIKQDCYGYEITKLIKNYSNDLIVIKDGTMHLILYKLLDERFISCYDKVVARKVRVYYHIELAGIDKFKSMVIDFNNMLKGINNIIR